MGQPDMTRVRAFRLKNRMLVANVISNVIGVIIIQEMIFRAEGQIPAVTVHLSNQIDKIFIPTTFVLGALFTLIYERPIRQLLNAKFHRRPISPGLWATARRRLLNEPFYLNAFNAFLWVSAAAIYSTAFFIADSGPVAIQRVVFGGLSTGLITVTVAFFVFEWILQSQLAPVLFPDGRLFVTPGTIPIRIRMRLFALLLACNLVPFVATLTVLHRFNASAGDPAEVLGQLRVTLLINSLVFMATGLWLTYLVSNNLTRPFKEIIRVLKGVRRGRLEGRVRVTSNDEIGYTGDVINEMTEGLRERERMRQSLNLAKDVQQLLLPQSDPAFSGWDIAGKSIYCDETGGDYYDFLESGRGRMGIVVGDVSGHGVPSALLMATARSLLRQRALQPGGIGDIVSDVNHLLTRDVGTSGRFMTLFYLALAARERSVRWVRAGHDPALLYDPQTDEFTELKGPGMAMGVDEDWQYSQQKTAALGQGQIILICTDGIHEAHNEKGEMFGKDHLLEIIRRHKSDPAADILKGVMSALRAFQGRREPEDDVTLVVVKAEPVDTGRVNPTG